MLAPKAPQASTSRPAAETQCGTVLKNSCGQRIRVTPCACVFCWIFNILHKFCMFNFACLVLVVGSECLILYSRFCILIWSSVCVCAVFWLNFAHSILCACFGEFQKLPSRCYILDYLRFPCFVFSLRLVMVVVCFCLSKPTLHKWILSTQINKP